MSSQLKDATYARLTNARDCSGLLWTEAGLERTPEIEELGQGVEAVAAVVFLPRIYACQVGQEGALIETDFPFSRLSSSPP